MTSSSSGLPMQLMRFVLVSVAGLVVDLGCAWLLIEGAGLPLVAGAATGFVTGALFNYALHSVWTFRSASAPLSVVRGSAYLGLTLVVLAVRAGVAFLLSPLAESPHARLMVLIVAVGASFTANFVLTRWFMLHKAGQA